MDFELVARSPEHPRSPWPAEIPHSGHSKVQRFGGHKIGHFDALSGPGNVGSGPRSR